MLKISKLITSEDHRHWVSFVIMSTIYILGIMCSQGRSANYPHLASDYFFLRADSCEVFLRPNILQESGGISVIERKIVQLANVQILQGFCFSANTKGPNTALSCPKFKMNITFTLQE